MSSLAVKILTVLVSTISDSQVFLLKKMCVAFATHIFSAKILAYMQGSSWLRNLGRSDPRQNREKFYRMREKSRLG